VFVHLSIGFMAVMILVLTAVLFRIRRIRDIPSPTEYLVNIIEIILESVLSERLRGIAGLSGTIELLKK
jgi:hypothetical protein